MINLIRKWWSHGNFNKESIFHELDIDLECLDFSLSLRSGYLGLVNFLQNKCRSKFIYILLG